MGRAGPGRPQGDGRAGGSPGQVPRCRADRGALGLQRPRNSRNISRPCHAANTSVSPGRSTWTQSGPLIGWPKRSVAAPRTSGAVSSGGARPRRCARFWRSHRRPPARAALQASRDPPAPTPALIVELTHDRNDPPWDLPGAVGRITELHATYYSTLAGFGVFFEAKVARELADFCERYVDTRDSLWLAIRNDRIEGAIAIDGSHAAADGAHLRWFITSEQIRGAGIGTSLLSSALAFAQARRYARIFFGRLRASTPPDTCTRRLGFVASSNGQARSGGSRSTNNASSCGPTGLRHNPLSKPAFPPTPPTGAGRSAPCAR